MKKFAYIVENLVANIAKFNDQASPPENWIDVSATACNIGWPIVGAVPLAPPSKWHTVNETNDGWEITAENQALKDIEEAVPTNEEIYDATIQTQKLLKAVVLSLNDGTFVPGAAISNSALKAIILANM